MAETPPRVLVETNRGGALLLAAVAGRLADLDVRVVPTIRTEPARG